MEGSLSNLASLREKVSNALSKKDEASKNNSKSKKNLKSNSKNNKEPSDKPAKKHVENKTPNDDDEQEILRREALNLGATEDDLKLVNDLDVQDESEQEFDDNDSKNTPNKELTKELSEFMKNIGFKSHKAEDLEVSDEEDTDAADGEAEEEEDKFEEEEARVEHDSDEEEADAISENEEEEEEEENNLANSAQDKNETDKTATQSKSSDKILNLQSVISDRLAVESRSDWYNISQNLEHVVADRSMKQSDVEELFEKAKRLIEAENQVYDEEFNKSSSQKRFLSQILTGGTLSDKISALTLLVQEAPLHNLRALDNLFNMCQKKSRTAALQCVDALVDLLVNTILPPNRKLKTFKKQPLSKSLSDSQLILMYFEDHLKTMYFQFISLLEKLSHDSILYVRMKIVSHIFSLLKAKPEQEANLLRLGVNKLGDIDNKVSSKTSYQILLLEQEHPAMKQVVCESVIDVVFRSNNDHHALYYSVNTLNQTILTRQDETLANKLVDAYFALFEKLLIKTDDENVGAFKESEHQKEGRRKKNVKRGRKGGKSVKKVKDDNEILEEKNSKMFAAILTGLNRAFPFSNFPTNIFENHLNILYKITHSLNFNTSVQALILIQTITNKFSDDTHKDRYFRTLYESLWDERLLNSSKQGIYLNLLFKSLKDDENIERVLAFVKRISQVCLNWLNIGTISGMIFLLIQLEREIPQVRNLFLNTPMDDEINETLQQEESLDEVVSENKEVRIYDPRKRDPKFVNADKSSIWEIGFFLKHYHPTIQMYAENFLKFDELSKAERRTINKPDLGLYSLSHFLDRFVYKRPKSKANLKGSSIMQPLGGAHTGNLLVRATGVESSDIPANTEDWLSKKASQIKPEDDFFYQYFSTKQEKVMSSKFDKALDQKAKNGDEDEDSELDDDAVWNALVASNPNVEGEDDDLDDELSDLNMSDFSEAEDEEEEGELDLEGGDEEGNSDEDEEAEEEEGLVRLRTIGDLDDEEEVEDESNDENSGAKEESDSSDGEDIKMLLEDDAEEDLYSSEDDSVEPKPALTNAKKSKKRSNLPEDGKKNKKIKISSLPTFASAEDYAEYLQSSDDE